MQDNKWSIIETVTNVGLGYIIAILTQLAVFPLFGVEVSVGQNFGIAALFTVISLIRSYCIRRWFNGMIWKRSK